MLEQRESNGNSVLYQRDSNGHCVLEQTEMVTVCWNKWH